MAELVLRLAQGNARWGYMRIAGECRKLGVSLSATSVRNILRRHRVGPARRRSGPNWTPFLRAQAAGALACDFLCGNGTCPSPGPMIRTGAEPLRSSVSGSCTRRRRAGQHR